MFEIIAVLGLVFIGLAAAALVTVGGLFLKLFLKILLIPLSIVGVVLKVVLTLSLIVIACIVAPVLIGVLFLIAIPALLLAGVCGLGWSLGAA